MAEQKLEEMRQIRLKKIEELRKLGVNPYPSKVIGNPSSISDVLGKMDQEAEVAGRLMAMREHGNIYFADLKDETGKIQLFFQKKSLEAKFKLLKLFDVGDFMFAKGKVFKTSAGETTIDVTDFQLLSKSVRPLPSTWFGFKDVEERYRKRYLDLNINDEVRNRFKIRTNVIDEIRKLLNTKNFLEVETPTLQPVYGGGFAKPFSTHHNALDSNFYLRISDEMYLKRLIVGGFSKVYEITKVFRNEGIDFDHNPEFTMFEAMIAYEDYTYGMDLIEEIIEQSIQKVIGKTKVDYQDSELDFSRPWQRLSLVEAVKKYGNIDPMTWDSLDSAKSAVKNSRIKEEKLGELKRMKKLGEVIAFAFEELVEEKLIQPTIIYDYPVEVSPLAKKCEDERFTQRFEMFAAGTEIGNNYTELNDPVDLRKRFIEEKEREKAGFEEAHQTDFDYLEAIEHGFPPTCGISIGIDRLVMLVTNASSLKEIILFPTLKPEVKDKTEKYDYKENKIVAIVDESLPAGKAMNALGHLAFSAGHYSEKSWMGQEILTDADGQNHTGISKYPFVVLKADIKHIRELINTAKSENILVMDYSDVMFKTGDDNELVNQMAKAKKTDLKYHVCLLKGKSEIINKLTRDLELYK